MDVDKELRAHTGRETASSRVLATLLFTDLAGSTRQAVQVGDRRWRQLLDRHHATVRELLDTYGGHEVDCAGDGFFATFDIASAGVACGLQLVRDVQRLGLRLRVGLHTGECERFDGKVGGIAVHAAARVVRCAEAGEVFVTETVRGVVAGSSLRFADRGDHELKGFEGMWRLYAAVPWVESAGGANARSVHRARGPRRPAPTRHEERVGPRRAP
jgi:class 3 adenylate cyclase